jgi:hypothetical protein
MNNQFKNLDMKDVVTLETIDNILGMVHYTFKTEEFIIYLLKKISGNNKITDQWMSGVNVEVLTSNTGWRKKKVRLTLEFCPETIEEESLNTNSSSSPLDDIRQNIN